MGNSMKRSVLKAQYERFCQAWKAERSYQNIVELTGQKLPDGVEKLGKKPTFNMWVQAVKNRQAAIAAQQKDAKKVEVNSTDWED